MKKKVLFGDERYIRDFTYLIDIPDLFNTIISQNSSFTEVYQVLFSRKENSTDDYFFIFCKYDQYSINSEADALGLIHGEDYINGTEMLHELDYEIDRFAKNRKVFVWGIGKMGECFFKSKLPLIGNAEIYGCVDINDALSGKTFYGKKIYTPEKIIDDPNTFFIVTTTEHYSEIKEYLLNKGKSENVDFVHMSQINRNASQMAYKVIFDIPKMDSVCNRPFEFAEICKGGKLGCCCGLTGVTDSNDSLYYTSFNNAWHSNVLKVIRLSMLNGTYTFCNPLKCEYLFNSKYGFRDTNEMSKGFCINTVDNSPEKETLCINTVINADYYTKKETEYPRTIQLSYDKSCNLFCKSCRPKIYVAKDNEKNKLEQFSERLLKEVVPHVRRLKFAGGETCISDIYGKIIFDPNHNIEEIAILSNGKCMNSTYINKLLERGYKKIDIVISMDGATKETAEKLRRGIDFDIWKKNMHELSNLRKEHKINMLGFTFVVQKDNYKEMKDYVDMCIQFGADNIRFSKLINWGEFSNDEYTALSMLDINGNPVPELQTVIEDKRFSLKQVKLFKWIEWFT